MMHRLRPLAALGLAIAVATCSDSPSVAPKARGAGGQGRFALAPVFSPAAAAVYAQRSVFADLTFDHVRVLLVRLPRDTVKDTTIVFTPSSGTQTLDLTVSVQSFTEVFTGILDYQNLGKPIYHGEGTVQARAEDEPPAPQTITVNYVGVGANATRVAVAPKTTTLVAPSGVAMTATVFDAANNPIADVPLSWTTSDATIATVSPTGAVATLAKRGTATITARTPTGLTDNGTVSVTLPPASIVLASGGGQTGKAGSALPSPAAVRVLAADGVGVGGVTVTFGAPSGGSINPTSAVTDASGQATTSLTLGGAVGPQSFAAAAAGFSVSIPATATPGDPAAIAAIGGGGQQDTIRRVLKTPLSVRVSDRFGNAINGVSVSWSRSGSGTLSAATSTTNAEGVASVSYTLGSTVGDETITATVSAGSAPALTASFTVKALPLGPSAIAAVSGGGQTGRIGQALAAPLVVRVTDSEGNAVGGVPVSWTAVNATVTASGLTGADGKASATMTLSNRVGQASATATISTATGPKAASFTATVQTGVVAQLVITASPATGTSGAALAPALRVELRDAGGNLTPAANPVSVALGNNPSGATLGGTLAVTSAAGVATFADLTLDKPGAGYTLVVSSAGVPSVTSAALAITGGVASTIAISGGDGQTATVGTAVAIAPAVRVVDANGKPVADVSVTFTPGTGSGVIAPTTPVATNSQGIAALTSWTLGTTPGPQTLVASAGTLGSVTFNATAQVGAANRMVLAAQPSAAAQTGVAFATQPVVQLQDANGNPVPQAGVVVTAGLASGSGTLGGVLTAATDATGRAAFSNLQITGQAGAYTLGFSATGLPGIVSTPVVIGAGTATALVFVQQHAASVPAGSVSAPPVAVAVVDAAGNTVTTATNPVTIAITANTGTPGSTMLGTLTVTPTNGVATFATAAVDRAGVNFRLTATAAGLTPATSAPFTMTPSAPGSLTIVSGDDQYYPSGYSSSRGVMVVIVKDALGAPVSTVPVTFAPAAGMTVNASPTPVVLNTNGAGTASANSWISAATGTGVVTVSAPGFAPLTFNSTKTANVPFNSSCALSNTGAAYCWGDNSFGTLGDGTTTNRNVPTPVLGGLTFTSLASSWGPHSCGLTASGQAYCWGRNVYGELGDGTTTNRTQPVLVQGGLTFASLYLNHYSTCGITTTNALYCWGWTDAGILGDTDRGTIRTTPTLVNTGGRTFTKVILLEGYTCGLESNGTVSCWGFTPDLTRVTPAPIPGGTSFADISGSSFGHACGVTTTGAGMCWGYSGSALQGQLGDGTINAHLTPNPVAGGLSFVEIRAFGSNSCGRTAANLLYCWGNSTGAVGDGATVIRMTPVPVASGHHFDKFLSFGGGHVCAMATTGVPFCWGGNNVGQLGSGNTNFFPQPNPVRWVEGTPGAAKSILVNGSTTRSAAPGTVVTPAPSVIVRDYAGNPVLGVAVTFTVTAGGGSVTGATALTNSSGVATVGSWTLGPTPGTNTLTATVAGIAPTDAQIVFTGFGTGGAPGVTISSIIQTGKAIPANLSAITGSIDVVANIQTNGQAMESVTAQLACPSSSMTQTLPLTGVSSGSGPVTLTLNTAEYNPFNGFPTLRNGSCTLTVTALSSGGSTAATVGLTLTNPDGVVLTNVFAATVSAEGISQFTSANDGQAMLWRAGAPTVTAMLVPYSARTVASVSITLPGAVVPTQTLPGVANTNFYAMTWSATATSPTTPNVTGLTIVDATGCVAPAAPPACGALEANDITPKGVTPTVSYVDNQGNPVNLVLLNPNTTSSTFRIDNTSPQAPLALNIPSSREGWVNATYTFANVGLGTSNANLTAGLTNYVSCGDGPDVKSDPYVCRPQIGVSASPNGQVGVGIGASNNLGSFTYYARPAAGYVPVNTTNGTSTSPAECDLIGWTKINNAGGLSASLQNNAYVVRVFERDRLNNARCTDLGVPLTASTLGTIFNTGVAGRFNTANQGRFGVDVVMPTLSFIEPATDPAAAGANQIVSSGAVPSYKVVQADNESGLRSPGDSLIARLTRLAIDPSTSAVATANSAFGCPVGFNGTTCASARVAQSLVVDASSNQGIPSGIEAYYTILMAAQDKALNSSPSITRTVLIDRTAPQVGGVAIPAALTGGVPATFLSSASDNLDVISGSLSLTYSAVPAGDAGSTFSIRETTTSLGVAFDNVLTTAAASIELTVPFFARNVATTTALGAPQNNGVAPSSVTVRAVDAASNVSAPAVAAIPPGNVPQTGTVNYAAAQGSGAVLQSFVIANPASAVSNCPAAGCAGGTPANPTTVNLLASATGSQGALFANPFARVQFYYQDGSEWILIGSATTPTIADNAINNTRTFTWALAAFDPPAALGSGTPLGVVAVGINGAGDALVTPRNTNIGLTNP